MGLHKFLHLEISSQISGPPTLFQKVQKVPYLVPEAPHLREVIIICCIVSPNISSDVNRTLKLCCVVNRTGKTVGVVIGGISWKRKLCHLNFSPNWPVSPCDLPTDHMLDHITCVSWSLWHHTRLPYLKARVSVRVKVLSTPMMQTTWSEPLWETWSFADACAFCDPEEQTCNSSWIKEWNA